MTATVGQDSPASSTHREGRISRVIGPVVDIEFPAGSMPDIYSALEIDFTLEGHSSTLVLEVAQHIGDNVVRAIALKPTDGLVRGMAVRNRGEGITVPVGDITLGKVFNVTGDCLNLAPGEEFDVKERWAIHRRPPAFDQLESRPRCSRPA